MRKSLQADKRGAIVLGGHVQALGIVRILGRRGIPVAVIDNTNRCIARRSKFCTSFYRVRDEELLKFLESSPCVANHAGWVIFPTNDYHVRILSVAKKSLGKFYTVTADRWETVSLFYNKINTYRLAVEKGIPIPWTMFPAGRDDLDNPSIPFPCIVKPAVMYDFYRKAGKKVFLCRNRQELEMNYLKALAIIPAGEIIVQEVIPGEGTDQFSACFLFLNGKSYASLTACRMRQHPLDFGNATTYAEVVDEPLLIGRGVELLEAAGYNGLCEVEFKRDSRDGTFRLLEVNPRTWKWHSISEAAGVQFLPLFFNHLSGKVIESAPSPLKASFCHSATDIPVRLLLLLRGAKYWNRKVSPVQRAVWSSDDPSPWFFEKLLLFDFLIKR